MEHSIFDEANPQAKETGSKLLESYQYWHRRRLPFNIIVGLSGFVPAAIFMHFNFDLIAVLGMIMWGIVANIFYSSGYMLESFIIVRSKGDKNLKKSREFLFGTGTLLYAGVSVFCFDGIFLNL